MTTAIHTRFSFSSSSQTLPADTFRVAGFEGREGISDIYRWSVDLVSDDPDVDSDEMTRWPVTLTIERDDAVRRVHGVVARFEQRQEGKDRQYFYRAVVVPRLWLLSLSRQNQIYQHQSIPQIIASELRAEKHPGGGDAARTGLTADDFEMRLTRSYPEKEYVVQYQETDLDFISRLMEHEGISYFFEHGRTKEKLVITDNNVHFPRLSGDQSQVSYRPPEGMATYVEEAVHELTMNQQRISKKVIIKDHNYRMPHVPLQAQAETQDGTQGLVSHYGEHFATPEEGAALARIRAQEVQCQHRVYSGSGDCSSFEPGYRFGLEEHFRSGFNQAYLITAVQHQGGQPSAGTTGPDAATRRTEYHNRFQAIAAAVPFRPQRRTPKPKMLGIMHAHVDSAQLEDRAEMDDQGRYKLFMPFDISGPGAGQATRYVRMAQPYGGQAHGMHFPLHKDTEVIWACIDGDPDRPIITGVVPNPLAPSLVTDRNYTQNVLRTASGIEMTFSDGAGAAAGAAGAASSEIKGQQQMTSVQGRRTADTGSGHTMRLTGQQQYQSDNGDVADSSGDGLNDTYFKVDVPHAGSRSYLRMGETPPSAVEPESWKTGLVMNKDLQDGVFSFTEQNRTLITRGNSEEYIRGRRRVTIGSGDAGVWDAGACYQQDFRKTGEAFGQDQWRLTTKQHVSADSYAWGDMENFFGGFAFNGSLAFTSDVFVGGKMDIAIGAFVSCNLGLDVNIGYEAAIDITKGPKVSLSYDEEIEARNSIRLRVPDKSIEPMSKWHWLGAMAAGGVVGGALSAAIGAGAGAIQGDNAEEDRAFAGEQAAMGAGIGVAAGVYAASIVAALSDKESAEGERHDTDSTIVMDKDNIILSSGPDEIKLVEDKAKGGQITITIDRSKKLSKVLIEAKKVDIRADKLTLGVDARKVNIGAPNSKVKIMGSKYAVASNDVDISARGRVSLG